MAQGAKVSILAAEEVGIQGQLGGPLDPESHEFYTFRVPTPTQLALDQATLPRKGPFSREKGLSHLVSGMHSWKVCKGGRK